MKKILIPLIFIISRTCFSMEPEKKRMSRRISIRTIPIQIPEQNISTSQSWPSIEERKKIFESKIKELNNEKQPSKQILRPKSSSYSVLPPLKREESECFGDDALKVNKKSHLHRRRSRKKIDFDFDTLRLKEKQEKAIQQTSVIESELKEIDKYIQEAQKYKDQLRKSKEETEIEANQVIGILAYKELIKKNKP